MSYRSKRTRALMTKDDELQVVKKMTSHVPATSTTLTDDVMSSGAGVRWGPFKPPTGHPQLRSDKSNCMQEGPLKSHMSEEPQNGQNRMIQKTSSIPKQHRATIQATISNKVNPSRPHNGFISDSPSNINESSLLKTTKTAPIWRNAGTGASNKKISVMGQQRSSLDKDFEKENASKEHGPMMLHKQAHMSKCSVPPSARYSQTHSQICDLGLNRHNKISNSHSNDVAVGSKDQESPIWRNTVTGASNRKISLMGQQRSSLDKENGHASKEHRPIMLHKQAHMSKCSVPLSARYSQTCDLELNGHNKISNNRSNDVEVGSKDQESPIWRNPVTGASNRKISLMAEHRSSLDKDFEKGNPSMEPDPKMLHKR